MATYTQFLGFKRVLTGATKQDNYLYFERANASAEEGKLWFNGTCYGSCRDTEVDKILEALEGFIPASGNVTDVKDYIDAAVSAITSGMTTSVESAAGAFSGLTIEDKSSTPNVKDYVIDLQNVAAADELAQEISDREAADTALQGEVDAIETAVGLSTGGTYVPGDGQFTSAATSVADAIEKLDDALASAVTDLESAIESAIDELDATVTADSKNEYMTVEIVEEDGKLTSVSVDDDALKAVIEGMDLAEVHEAGKAIVAVSEEDGVVSATAGTVAAEFVDVADAGNHFTADNVEDALAELYTGYTAGDAALLGDATESGNTLGKLEDRIEALDANAKEYHLVKNEDNLPAEVKEQYYLADADGNQSGATINIYKDSHIKSITYITDSADTHFQNLKYEYIDVCGDTKTEYVDMSALILEQEFASGITVNGAGIVHGVVDPTSENFLTVGADGFKLDGVQDAIDEAVAAEASARTAADTAITESLETTASTLYNMITGLTDGLEERLEQEIADRQDGDETLASAITEEANAREAADDELQDEIEALTGLTHDLQAELDAVEGSLGFNNTAYTKDNTTYATGSTVTDDVELLDAALGVLNDNLADVQDELAATATSLSNAIEDEASARTAADNALDERLDVVEGAYLTGVTVNDCAATITDHVAEVEIHADDIEIGKALSGTTVSAAADDTIDEVLQSIMDELNSAVAGSYSGVTSTGNTLAVTDTFNGNNVEFVKETPTQSTVEAGHLELAQNANHEWYGQMFWIDEETSE